MGTTLPNVYSSRAFPSLFLQLTLVELFVGLGKMAWSQRRQSLWILWLWWTFRANPPAFPSVDHQWSSPHAVGYGYPPETGIKASIWDLGSPRNTHLLRLFLVFPGCRLWTRLKKPPAWTHWYGIESPNQSVISHYILPHQLSFINDFSICLILSTKFIIKSR